MKPAPPAGAPGVDAGGPLSGLAGPGQGGRARGAVERRAGRGGVHLHADVAVEAPGRGSRSALTRNVSSASSSLSYLAGCVVLDHTTNFVAYVLVQFCRRTVELGGLR